MRSAAPAARALARQERVWVPGLEPKRRPRSVATTISRMIAGAERANAADIAAGGKVVLVKPMAFTHHTDTEQRVLELEFELSGSALRAVAPKGIQNPWNGRPLAPRGYYMLFLFDSRGVPSTAEFVKLH